MILLASAGLVFLSSAMASQTAPGGSSAKAEPPSVGGKPVEVAIGFYAIDFARVTSREESFDVTGYLELSWRDPGLAAGDVYVIRSADGSSSTQSSTVFTLQPDASGTACITVRVNRDGRSGDPSAQKCASPEGSE